MIRWKYEIWCEAGFLHGYDGWETQEEAEEEAKNDLTDYPDDGEYWYEVEYYEEEDEDEEE